jgi:Ca2+-binding EF-hand superfamily protein
MGLAAVVALLAGCQSGMPMMAGSLAPQTAPQARAASVDGFKARIRQSIESEFLARDTGKKDKYLDANEARMPVADFKRADKNLDGKLDLTELLEYLHRDLFGPFNQKFVPIFKQLDANASNFLEEAEFAKVQLTSPGPDGQPLRPTTLMYRMADRNRDFKVDYDEFEDLMAWDTADLLPEYFRAPSAPVAPVMPPPGLNPPAKPPAPVAPPAVQPPVAPKAPVAPPAVINPPAQAVGDPPHPEPDRFGQF